MAIVELYDHCDFNTRPGDEGGQVKLLDSSSADLGDFNNRLSSLKINLPTGADAGNFEVKFYNDTNFNGLDFSWPKSFNSSSIDCLDGSGIISLLTGAINDNDNIESVEIIHFGNRI